MTVQYFYSRTGILIIMALCCFQLSCEKDKPKEIKGKVYGKVYIKDENTPMENARISVYGVTLVEQTSFSFDPLYPLDSPFYQYTESRIEKIAETFSGADGTYEINFQGQFDQYFIEMKENTISDYDLQECVGFSNELYHNELSQPRMEVDFVGQRSHNLYLEVRDTSCQDSSLLKNLTIGHFEDDGSKNSDIVLQGDRYCDTLDFHSKVMLPGYIEFTVEKNGQQFYTIDSITNLENCDEKIYQYYY